MKEKNSNDMTSSVALSLHHALLETRSTSTGPARSILAGKAMMSSSMYIHIYIPERLSLHVVRDAIDTSSQ